MTAASVVKCLVLSVVVVLCACSEKPQTAGVTALDQSAYSGTGMASFTATGWTAGDKTSWEQGLKARQLYGQNEYSRFVAAPRPSSAAK